MDSIDKLYELRADNLPPENGKEPLQYPVLMGKGINIIAEKHYKAKYNIDIEAIEYDPEKNGDIMKFISSKFQEEFNLLKKNKAKGIVLVEYCDNKLNHVSPFIILKTDDNKNSLFLFELSRSSLGREIEDTFQQKKEYIVNYTDDYQALQTDDHSCPIFSLLILKTCLLNQELIKTIEKQNPKPVKIPEISAGQHKKLFEELPQDKHTKYIKPYKINSFTD